MAAALFKVLVLRLLAATDDDAAADVDVDAAAALVRVLDATGGRPICRCDLGYSMGDIGMGMLRLRLLLVAAEAVVDDDIGEFVTANVRSRRGSANTACIVLLFYLGGVGRLFPTHRNQTHSPPLFFFLPGDCYCFSFVSSCSRGRKNGDDEDNDEDNETILFEGMFEGKVNTNSLTLPQSGN